MKVTIIPSDGVVGIDGAFRSVAGLQVMFPDVHAVQWNGTDGHIEYNDGRKNEGIDSISGFQSAIDAWNANIPSAPGAPPLTATELLAKAKADKQEEIEAAYEAAVGANIFYLGMSFQADTKSQALITQVLTASGGVLPPDFVWYDANNLPQSMNYAALQGLAGVILLRGQPLFAQKQARKAVVRAATTIAEVGAVTW